MTVFEVFFRWPLVRARSFEVLADSILLRKVFQVILVFGGGRWGTLMGKESFTLGHARRLLTEAEK